MKTAEEIMNEVNESENRLRLAKSGFKLADLIYQEALDNHQRSLEIAHNYFELGEGTDDTDELEAVYTKIPKSDILILKAKAKEKNIPFHELLRSIISHAVKTIK